MVLTGFAAAVAAARAAAPAAAGRRFPGAAGRGFAAGMALRERLDVPGVVVPARNRHPDDLFDLAQVFEFVLRAEGHRAAIRAGPRRAADPVDVGFRFVRQIEVHHQADRPAHPRRGRRHRWPPAPA